MHTLIFNIGLIPCKQVVVLDIKTISSTPLQPILYNYRLQKGMISLRLLKLFENSFRF